MEKDQTYLLGLLLLYIKLKATTAKTVWYRYILRKYIFEIEQSQKQIYTYMET